MAPMALDKKAELVVERKFDRQSCRHLFNGKTYVFHCHHYATLYCQLADDAEQFHGADLLRKAAETTFRATLRAAFESQGIDCLDDRIALAEEYWRFAGMGLLTFEKVGPVAATARMDHSHVDEGWIKKWGQREAPVNFIGQGYLAAAMAAIYDEPEGSYTAHEVESIVAGAAASRFRIVRH